MRCRKKRCESWLDDWSGNRSSSYFATAARRSCHWRIRAYFFANFARLAGNLHIYAPTLPPGGGEFELEFDGLYEVIAEQEGEVTLDGRRLEAGQRVHLRAGRHRGESQHGFRLKLHPPEWEALVDPRYREERADFMFFRYRL